MTASSICSDQWFICRSKRPRAALRMFCLAYAGGGASAFNSWSNTLADSVEVLAVELPGRETRYSEPYLTGIQETAKVLADAIIPCLDRPYALFGYSMGALIAFELIRELRRREQPLPIQLFTAAMRAPQTPPICPSLTHLPNHSFIEEVRHYYDPPRDAWDLPELIELILPTLRADMKMCDAYAYSPELPFDCPVHTFAGQDDRTAPPALIREWRQQTTGEFGMDVFDGTHFFMEKIFPDLKRVLMAHLARL